MSPPPAPPSTEEAKAARLLRVGSALAVAGSFLLLGGPTALLFLARRHLYGLAPGAGRLVGWDGYFVIAGGIFVLLALLSYRRSFSHLKHADAALRPAAFLCLIGSLGALVLVVAGAYLTAGASGITGCLSGRSDHALACLRSADPTAGALAIAGFWLAWLGIVGVAGGLFLSGRHFRRGLVSAGGALFALLAADLLVPFVAVLARVPDGAYALAIAPFAAVLAGLLVLIGAPTGGAAAA